MATPEFDLINRYFSNIGSDRPDVILGVGDDCALLQVPVGHELAVSMDTLVEEVHFSAGTDPEALGHKVLAVNLSDLAAMGAVPAWVTLALTLPSIDDRWLAAFSRGFSALAQRSHLSLVGGDTTRGPLSITVQVHGLLPAGEALRREGARPGDLVYVTGTLGGAALALRTRQGYCDKSFDSTQLQAQLDRPEPRLAVGQALRGLASAAIDLSDGLIADLGHICQRSGVAARLLVEKIPCSAPVRRYIDGSSDWSIALAGGDDYELCFTLPADRQGELESLVSRMQLHVSRIGVIESGHGVHCVDSNAQPVSISCGGYDHFHHLS